MSLKILPVKSLEDDTNHKLDKRLPKPPFLGILNGSVRSGKSTLLMNLIYNDQFYKDIFDKVILISPTCENDKTLHYMNEDDDIIKICDGLDAIDDILKSIVKIQKDELKKGDGMNTLLILDDMLGYIKQHSYLSNLCTRYRHFKISLIITTQSFRAIPNVVRTNASFYIIFTTQNDKELQKLDDEFGGLIPNFKSLFKMATDDMYNFLYIDLKKVIAYHNFDDILYEKHKK